MSAELTGKRGLASTMLEHAVFTLDRWLRRRNGTFEFTAEPCCLFRIECSASDQSMHLSDGTRLRPADPVLKLHLWNEHIPPMGQRGPTLAWARQVSRAIDVSLKELARYCAQRPELDRFLVICGDMHLGTPQQRAQLARIMARYGFESRPQRDRERRDLHRIGAYILIALLILVINPVALRSAILRRYRTHVFLSRAVLERRYGVVRPARSRPATLVPGLANQAPLAAS